MKKLNTKKLIKKIQIFNKKIVEIQLKIPIIKYLKLVLCLS